MIEVDIQLTVRNQWRSFNLSSNFSCDSGICALYGDSGAGKTLTLQAIAGLKQPQQAQIKLNHKILVDSEQGINLAPQQRNIGYVWQDYALFPHLNVFDNISFAIKPWPFGKLTAEQLSEVQYLLDLMGLQDMARSKPQEISGGQRQRVALARALAAKPQLILLDEPFAALNSSLRQTLRQELLNLQQQTGIQMLLVSHDIEDILALAQQVVLYQNGHSLKQFNINGLSKTELLQQLQIC